MIRDVADITDISCKCVHKILCQNMEMKKVCSKLGWKVLTPEQMKERVLIAEMFCSRKFSELEKL